MKNRTRLCQIITFAAVIMLTFGSCDNENTNNSSQPFQKEDFFGTWVGTDSDADFTLIISANSLEVKDAVVPSNIYKLQNLIWTKIVNTGFQEFPYGYDIEGQLTFDSTDNGTRFYPLTLNTAKNKMYTYEEMLFIKQQ